MKLNTDIISERKAITSSPFLFRHTPLIANDITDHKHHLEKIYKELLHEACVIDDCCWRFEKMFRCN